jgi:hypothetical protein
VVGQRWSHVTGDCAADVEVGPQVLDQHLTHLVGDDDPLSGEHAAAGLMGADAGGAPPQEHAGLHRSAEVDVVLSMHRVAHSPDDAADDFVVAGFTLGRHDHCRGEQWWYRPAVLVAGVVVIGGEREGGDGIFVHGHFAGRDSGDCGIGVSHRAEKVYR